jgi:hypothetical protein
MANTVKMKRSAVAGKVPTTSNLDLGELGVNTYDGKLYLKKDNGTASIVEVGALQGASAVALHRSPNAITQMFVYDTTKDSDGGAWTKKCQNTSWYNETLAGFWLGQQASDAAARAISGATTNDYYQLTTDGKFYKLWKNLFKYTADFSNAIWVAQGVTKAADTLTEDTTNAQHRVYQDITTVLGSTYTLSASLKQGTQRYAFLSLTHGSTAGVHATAVFDLQTGTLTTTSAGTNSTIVGTSITDDGSGYWRCSITASQSATAFARFGIGLSNSGTPSYTVFGQPTYLGASLTIQVKNAQLELSSSLTSYEAKTADGTSTEIFRGNKAEFPKLAAIVAEASSITIYDLLALGNPMWMRFASSSAATFSSSYSITALAMLNGVLCGGQPTAGLRSINFPADRIYGWRQGTATTYQGNFTGGIADRNSSTALFDQTVAAGGTLANVSVNAVAMTVLPDAPLDATTGLQVPTIAAANNGGLTIINDTGVARSDTSVVGAQGVTFDLSGNVYWSRDAFNVTNKFATPSAYRAAANFGTTFSIGTGTPTTWVPGLLAPFFVATKKGRVLGRTSTGSAYTRLGAGMYLVDQTRPQRSMTAFVHDAYNTGWLLGEVRRCYMSDVSAGTISNPSTITDRSYKASSATVTGTLTKTVVASGASLVAYSGFTNTDYAREAAYSADLDFGTAEWSASAWINIPTANAAAGIIISREYSAGSYITLGIDATNKITATAYDGTTTRTVTSALAYNSALWLLVTLGYYTDGSLVIFVNGLEVARTVGNPLLTLNNANALLTIGNNYALTSAFPGSIAFAKLGVAAPTPEQAAFIFEQEKQLFRANAVCILPDTGTLSGPIYDDTTDRWAVSSTSNISYWNGLVRVSSTAVPAGSYGRPVGASGIEIVARTTTNPGVYLTYTAPNIREELLRKAEVVATRNKELVAIDYVGGFTATTTNGSTALTAVAGLSIPTSYIGARISGTGIPANAYVVAVSGTTIYISAAATASAAGVSISFLDFKLPMGMEASVVSIAGTLKQEGSTKDYTRIFDGFVESVRFGVAPSITAWVQIRAQRATQ